MYTPYTQGDILTIEHGRYGKIQVEIAFLLQTYARTCPYVCYWVYKVKYKGELLRFNSYNEIGA